MMEVVLDWKSIGSLLATMMFLRSAVRDFLPAEVRHLLHTLFARLVSSVRRTVTIVIDEFDAGSGANELYEAAQSYLSSRCLSSASVLRLSKPRNSRVLTSTLPSAHSADDVFDGIQLKWSYHCLDRPSTNSNPFSHRSSSEHRYFELSFHHRHRAAVHNLYIPHLLEEAARLRLKSRERRLYTNRSYSSSDDHVGHRLWSSVPFHHPSTFDTLAIDPGLLKDIKSDLLRFSGRRDYYARVGRAWKRGYLLHGPPGTGKTSLIAAIANFLDFDVYDLELTAVHSNSNLRKLLVSTSTKSVIVVEDVDCSLDLSNRARHNSSASPFPSSDPDSDDSPTAADGGGGGGGAPAITTNTVSLSGVLNFVDGLWSSCVGERLMIFTTNHPERLDPALLRPGRMDRRIHLSYCEPAAFRVLARNYLEVGEGHEMMAEAEELIREVRVTPAEVAEVLMGCDGDGADVGMRKVLEELRRRKAAAAVAAAAVVDSGDELAAEEEEKENEY